MMITKILNGMNVWSWTWPFVFLLTICDPLQCSQCSSAYIGNQWLLTAAHCVNRNATLSIFAHREKPDLFGYFHGTNRTFEQIPITQKYIHPQYNPSLFRHDIALLRLKHEPSHPNAFLRIPVHTQWEEPGTKLWISGYGSQESMIFPFLSYAQVFVHNVQNIPYHHIYHHLVHPESMLIAADFKDKDTVKDNIDTCYGDSGGPLFYDWNGFQYIIGLTSWGIGCGQDDLPGVYTRVSYFKKWIEMIMK